MKLHSVSRNLIMVVPYWIVDLCGPESTFDFWDPPELFLDFWDGQKMNTSDLWRLVLTGVGSYNPVTQKRCFWRRANHGIPNLQKVGIVLLEK